MRRLSIRLPDPAYQRLQEHARQTGLPAARAITDLVCTTLDADAIPANGSGARHARRDPAQRRASANPAGTSPPWLPSDTDPHWAQNTKDAIDALRNRYPNALAKLEHDWQKHPERAEVLAALATWRTSIDTQAEDPREELSFHNALQQLTRTLDRSTALNTMP